MREAASRKASQPRDLAMEVAGESLRLLPAGAMWWEEARLLVVSDLHLEKGSAHAARGQPIPPYDTRETLGRLRMLVDAFEPVTVVSLGDSFHDRRARSRMAAGDVAAVRALTAACDWVWIEGNHDPAPPEDMGGRRMPELRMGPLVFRHEPEHGEKAQGEICGHLHPCARVAGRSGSVRTRCFATDGRRMVMPAFGAFTGGLNVLDAAFRPLFPKGLMVGMVGRDGVYAAGQHQLVG